MSLLNDVLEERYDYTVELFASDLAFSVVQKAGGQSFKVHLTPAAYDSDVRPLLAEVLRRTLGEAPSIEKSGRVTEEELVSVEIMSEEKAVGEYAAFSSYLKEKGLSVTEDEFRLIKLAAEYENFRTR